MGNKTKNISNNDVHTSYTVHTEKQIDTRKRKRD